jgi:hypothetical protein
MGALTLAVCLASASDAATTHYALRHGMVEANPIARAFIGERPAMVWAFNGMTTGALLYAVNRAPRRLRKPMKIGAAIAYGVASVLNVVRIRQR